MFTTILHAFNCCKLCINDSYINNCLTITIDGIVFHKLQFCLILCVHCILLCVLGFRSLSPSVDKAGGTTGAMEAIAPLQTLISKLGPLCAHWLRDKPICCFFAWPKPTRCDDCTNASRILAESWGCGEVKNVILQSVQTAYKLLHGGHQTHPSNPPPRIFIQTILFPIRHCKSNFRIPNKQTGANWNSEMASKSL